MKARIASLPAWVVPAVLGLFALALLLPVIHAPFFSDDVTYSELNGYRRIEGFGLIELDLKQIAEGTFDQGRPQFLGGLLGYPTFTLLGDHAMGYHVWLILLTAGTGLVLFGMLRRLGAPTATAVLAVVLGIAWLQLRIYHDSLLSFTGLIQVVLAAGAGSLWRFAAWLDEGRRRDLVIAVLLLVVACGLYEIAYTLFLAHAALAFTRRRGRAAVRAAAPFALVSVTFLLFTLVLRLTADQVSSGYSVGGGGGPWTILRTYAIQLISPLPDINLLNNPGLAADPTTGEWFAAGWRGVAVAAVAGALGLTLLRARAVRLAPMVAVGAALYIAPPILLSVSAKYQSELSLSQAYLPTMIQVFALGILVTAAFAAMLRAAARRGRLMGLSVLAAIALFCGLTAGVTAFNNVRILGVIQPDAAARELIEHGAEHGAFADVPAGASVFFSDHDLLWQGPTPYRGYAYIPLMLTDKTDRVYDARLVDINHPPGTCPATGAKVETPCGPATPQSAYARFRLRKDGGTVIVVASNGAKIDKAPAGRLAVYRETNDGSAPGPPELRGGTVDGKPWTSAGVSWSRTAKGDGWAVYTGELPARPRVSALSVDDPQGFIDFTAMPAEPQRSKLMGTRRLLP